MKKEPIEITCTGCGSEFRFWVPENLLDGKGEELNCLKCPVRFTVKKGSGGIEVSQASGKDAASAEPERKKPKTSRSGEPKARVLFVDDDKLAIAIVETALAEIEGVDFVMVRSGEEALKKFNGGAFNLVITDLHLKRPDDPEANIDGDELLEKLVDSGKNIPAIVTTGQDIVDDLILDSKWLGLNVKGFVQKGNPFWAEELKTKIKELLNIVF